MADQWYGGQSGGERWNVNLPAVVGVVFAFLVGVVIWVIATSGDEPDSLQSVDTAATTLPTLPPASTTPTTTPQPMPSTTPVPVPGATTVPGATVAPTVAPTAPPATTPVTVPPATAPSGPTTTAPAGTGDLGVPGHPIQRPACDGSYITVIASAIGDEASAAGLAQVLDQYQGASYLRTDLTCPSLTQSVDGQPIYVVYLGPYGADVDACSARSQGPQGAYVRRLSDDLDPTHSVNCP